MDTAAKNLMNDTVTGSGAFLTSPETCLEVAKYAIEAAAERMKSKTKTVGNNVTADTIMSYSLSYGHVVTVSGKRDAERDLWEFAGTIDGKIVIRGEVLGGKWRASTYLKFVRNGLLSRARRHKVNPGGKGSGGVMARQCCKMCRHYRSAVMGFGGEPLDTVAYCGTVRRVVESDDLCEGFSPSLWGAAVENESEEGGVK